MRQRKSESGGNGSEWRWVRGVVHRGHSFGMEKCENGEQIGKQNTQRI